MLKQSCQLCIGFSNLLSAKYRIIIREMHIENVRFHFRYTHAHHTPTHIGDDIRLHSWFYITQNKHLPYRFTVFFLLALALTLSRSCVNLEIILNDEHRALILPYYVCTIVCSTHVSSQSIHRIDLAQLDFDCTNPFRIEEEFGSGVARACVR